MLSEDMIAEIEDAVQQVAVAGWGVVSIVVERGVPVRIQKTTDLKFAKAKPTSPG